VCHGECDTGCQESVIQTVCSGWSRCGNGNIAGIVPCRALITLGCILYVGHKFVMHLPVSLVFKYSCGDSESRLNFSCVRYMKHFFLCSLCSTRL
jgi:hypothetical protein